MGGGISPALNHSLTLTTEQMQEMIDHASEHAPLEACGILAGKNRKVHKVIRMRNQAQSPVRYLMAPADQLEAFNWMDSNGLELIGIFHSHPRGPETVSPTDIAEAAYAVVHVILACLVTEWRIRGFWIENGTYHEVPLHII